MTVRRTVRATEPTAVFSPQRKYKTVGSSPSPATRKAPKLLDFGAFFCHFGTFLTHLKIFSNTFSNTSSNKALFFKVSKYFEIAQNMKNTQMQSPKELR